VKPEIEILPALPKAWPAGSVKGLRARSGFEVDATWKDGKLVETAVRALQGGSAQLRMRRGDERHHAGQGRGLPLERPIAW